MTKSSNESILESSSSKMKSSDNELRIHRLKNLQTDLNPKFMEKKSPVGQEKKSRYGRVQKELISSKIKSPTNVQTLTGFFRLSPKTKNLKPKILSGTLAESLVKKNRDIINNSINSKDNEMDSSDLKELDYDSSSVSVLDKSTDDTNNNNKCHDSLPTFVEENINSSSDILNNNSELKGEDSEKQNLDKSLSSISDNIDAKTNFFDEVNLDDFQEVHEKKNPSFKISEEEVKLDDFQEVHEKENPSTNISEEEVNLDDSLESPDFEIHDPSNNTVKTESNFYSNEINQNEDSKQESIEIDNDTEIKKSDENIDLEEKNQIDDVMDSQLVGKDSIDSIKSPGSKDSANGSSIDAEITSVQSGQLFWAQIGTYPYWPCMISPDPEKKTVSYKENISTKSHIIYHVRFFADNGRRSWVRGDKMLPYNGRESFVQKFSNLPKEPKKQKNRYSMDLLFKKTLKNKTWEQAILEADSLLPYSLHDRIHKFESILITSRNAILVRRLSKSSMYDSQDSLLSSSLPTTKKRARSNSCDSSSSTVNSLNQPTKKKRKMESVKKEPPYKESLEKEADFKTFAETLKYFLCNGIDSEEVNTKWSTVVDIKSLWELFVESHDGLTDISKKKFIIRKIEENSNSVRDRRSLKREVRGIDEVVDDIFNLGTDYLFDDLTNEAFCKFCKNTESEPSKAIFKCPKACGSCFHLHCLKDYIKKKKISNLKGEDTKALTQILESPVCDDCLLDENHTSNCFVCKGSVKYVDNIADEKCKCLNSNCGKYYHKSCLKMWPQSTWHTGSAKINFICPSHTCHTCVSDNPRGKSLQHSKTKFMKCIMCPASYHRSSTCIPAGTQLLNNWSIVCPRHDQNPKKHVNVDWCFFCAEGGQLICCETCPASVHPSCVQTPIPNEKYICDDCESGRLPLYGEQVWVRFGIHRWWPSLILPPSETPFNIRRMKHFPSEFVVRFFGTNDHGWISRSRVYLCQDDDWNIGESADKKNALFLKGVEEAKYIMEVIKLKKQSLDVNELDNDEIHTPFPYVKLKINRLVPPVKFTDLYDEDKVINCNCQKDIDHPCGPDTGCLNRSLFIECDPKTCPAGERCENQLFEKRIYPNMKIKYLKGKGFGLIALESIPSGTFVTEYVGEIIDNKEYQRRLKQQEHEKNDDYYFLTLQNNYFIDAGPKGNIGRFMNHSCEPNCETQKWTVGGITRIGLFSIRDIEKNEELTFNYMFESASVNKKVCFCQSSKCSGFIGEKYTEKSIEVSTQKSKKYKKNSISGKHTK